MRSVVVSSCLLTFEPARVRSNSASIIQYATMLAFLVTEPTVTQNSPFLPPSVIETVASTHCSTYPRTDGQAEWA